MTLALGVRNTFSWLLVCPLEVKRRRVSNENPPDDAIWKGALPASAPFSPIAFSGYLGGPANFLVGKLAGAFQDLTTPLPLEEVFSRLEEKKSFSHTDLSSLPSEANNTQTKKNRSYLNSTLSNIEYYTKEQI
ncbi:hypothetical protein AVEN_68884-1 [Araneus ventricosus]|uniref:Uncharacterized protein n=1 Tax=Araneus ventricosus TaxID=182803 RepID=A0A4Y2C8H5_ARAVE|nr:hypothetical protein AVEN_68884-1 [Araneus ventricosus]